MKKIILPAFILLLSSFILTACLKTDVQSTATPTDYIKLSSSDDNKQGNVIKTDYYSIKIPELWKYYGYEIMNNTLSVHESYSYDEIQGGHLFSISLFPESEDFSYLPAYDILGTLNTPEGLFNVVVIYPTDVQFTDDTARLYMSMANDVDSVIDSITFSDDCEFIEATAEPFTSPVSLSNGCWTRSLNDSEAEKYYH